MDLRTPYLGMMLKNPIVPSAAAPLSKDLGRIKRLEDSGAAAIVLYSLFEEQIVHEGEWMDYFLSAGADSHAEATSYFPEFTVSVGSDEYLNLIRKAKAAVGIPVIASLNGATAGGWTSYALKMQQAGADALELNIYTIPTNPFLTGEDVERQYLEIVREVKRSLRIPLAVKVGPYFSSMANMAFQLQEAGADALVLFNRFYQPDFDLETLDVVPRLVLSDSLELRLPLHWAAILYNRVGVDLAITTGIHTHHDVLKAVMAGASVTMMASELIANGPQRIQSVLDDVRRWMEEREYLSIAQMKGSMSQVHVADSSIFERMNYMRTLHSFPSEPSRQTVG